MAAVGGDDLIYMMKINYYPPCPRPDLALGVVAHTDMSTLTILVPNEVAGLQVFKDDRWYDVKYIPNALIVHIGDQIEVCLIFLYIVCASLNPSLKKALILLVKMFMTVFSLVDIKQRKV